MAYRYTERTLYKGKDPLLFVAPTREGPNLPKQWGSIGPAAVDDLGRKIADTLNASSATAAAASAMLAALKQAEDLLAELQDGGAENPELDTVRAAIAAAEAAGIQEGR